MSLAPAYYLIYWLYIYYICIYFNKLIVETQHLIMNTLNFSAIWESTQDFTSSAIEQISGLLAKVGSQLSEMLVKAAMMFEELLMTTGNIITFIFTHEFAMVICGDMLVVLFLCLRKTSRRSKHTIEKKTIKPTIKPTIKQTQSAEKKMRKVRRMRKIRR